MCEASSGSIDRRRLAVERERAADEPARLGEERVAQAALAVEVVDRHVHERVRRQRPDGAALPDAVLADEVRDPVLVRRELRPDRGDGLQRQVDARRRAPRRTAVRRRAVGEERRCRSRSGRRPRAQRRRGLASFVPHRWPDISRRDRQVEFCDKSVIWVSSPVGATAVSQVPLRLAQGLARMTGAHDTHNAHHHQRRPGGLARLRARATVLTHGDSCRSPAPRELDVRICSALPGSPRRDRIAA